jgi:hypothetical protein
MPKTNRDFTLDPDFCQTIIGVPETQGVEQLAEYYRRLRDAWPDGISAGVEALVNNELTLEGDDYRKLVRRRLLAWLSLSDQDRLIVADAHRDAMNRVPAGPAMREVTVLQSIANQLPLSMQAGLRGMVSERVLGALARPLAEPATLTSSSRPWRPWFFIKRSSATTSAVEPARFLPS